MKEKPKTPLHEMSVSELQQYCQNLEKKVRIIRHPWRATKYEHPTGYFEATALLKSKLKELGAESKAKVAKSSCEQWRDTEKAAWHKMNANMFDLINSGQAVNK